MLLIPDTHIPFHDQRCWRIMLKAAKAWKPDTVVIKGDFLDCFGISFFDRDPRRESSLSRELVTAKHKIKELETLGAFTYIYCEGNHEERIRRHIARMNRNLGAIAAERLKLRDLLELDAKWEWVPYKKHRKVGEGLYVTHDVGKHGVTAVRDAGQRYTGHSVSIGHVHRGEVIYGRDIQGRVGSASCSGWLGSFPEADYMPPGSTVRDWVQGFGIAYIDGEHVAQHFIPIIKGRCILEGCVYKA